MTRSMQTIFGACLALFLCSCSSSVSYWGSRADDAKDFVTLTAGRGAGSLLLGVKAQAGPIWVDTLYAYEPLFGLQGGEWFLAHSPHDENFHISEGNSGIPLLFLNSECVLPNKHAVKRGKAYMAMTPFSPVFLPSWIFGESGIRKSFCPACSSREQYARRKADRKFSDRRNDPAKLNQYTMEINEIKIDPQYGGPEVLVLDAPVNWAALADVNVVVVMIGGFRIGFNIVEFADFLAGFLYLDPCSDDIAE